MLEGWCWNRFFFFLLFFFFFYFIYIYFSSLFSVRSSLPRALSTFIFQSDPSLSFAVQEGWLREKGECTHRSGNHLYTPAGAGAVRLLRHLRSLRGFLCIPPSLPSATKTQRDQLHFFFLLLLDLSTADIRLYVSYA